MDSADPALREVRPGPGRPGCRLPSPRSPWRGAQGLEACEQQRKGGDKAGSGRQPRNH